MSDDELWGVGAPAPAKGKSAAPAPGDGMKKALEPGSKLVERMRSFASADNMENADAAMVGPRPCVPHHELSLSTRLSLHTLHHHLKKKSSTAFTSFFKASQVRAGRRVRVDKGADGSGRWWRLPRLTF